MSDRNDEEHWAKPVERIEIGDMDPEATSINVAGRRLTGPLQGFGQLWRKTYQIKLGQVPPTEVIAVWKAEYGSFWPRHTRFYAPIAGIRPGEVGIISSRQGPVRLSTGVLVLYADDTSFTFMTPEGHPFAGWITFSGFPEEGETVAQTQVLMRANDPLYEAGLVLYAHRIEDKMWMHTLRALATRMGITAEPVKRLEKLDRRRQWRRFGNIRHNSMLRSPISRRKDRKQ